MLTRIWCLYEIQLTLESSDNPSEGLIILTSPTDENITGLQSNSHQILEMEMLQRLGNYNDLYLIMASIDCRRATATFESDRKRIMDDIESHIGISRMNKDIKDVLFAWLGATAHCCASQS